MAHTVLGRQFVSPLWSTSSVLLTITAPPHGHTAWPYSLGVLFCSTLLFVGVSIRYCGLVPFKCLVLGVCWASWICELMVPLNSDTNLFKYLFLSSSFFSCLSPVTHISPVEVVYGSVTCYVSQTGRNESRSLLSGRGLSCLGLWDSNLPR